MFNQISKAVGIGFASSLALAITANNAQAYDFAFSGYTAENFSASGTIRIDDAAIPASGTTTISSSDFLDWEITAEQNGSSFTFIGPGGSFGATNSELYSGFSNTALASSTTLTLGGTASPFAIVDESGSFTHYIFGADSSEIRSGGRTNGQAFQNLDGSYIEAQAVATPVPFGVSTDLSIIILGSLYGASRLRKKLAANK